jgi:hypothetical protein
MVVFSNRVHSLALLVAASNDPVHHLFTISSSLAAPGGDG